MIGETSYWVDPQDVWTEIPEVRWEALRRFGMSVEVSSKRIGQSSEQVQGVRYKPRTVVLPFVVREATPAARDAALRAWVGRLTATTDGSLHGWLVRDALGVRRVIYGVPVAVDVPEQGASSGPLHQFVNVSLWCPDPFWIEYDGDVSIVYDIGADPDFSVGYLGYGDVSAWPTWNITGPVDDVDITETNTGNRLVLVGLGIGVGETLTIDTDPTRPGYPIRDGAGVSKFTNLDLALTTEEWPIIRSAAEGYSAITYLFDGVSDGDSSLELVIRPRYAGP